MEEGTKMAPNSNLQPSPTSSYLQWRQQHHENEVKVEVEQQQQHTYDYFQADENGPTHHPSAPPGELFNVQTTIDPSYIISLIRNLLPVDERQGDDLQGLGEWNNSAQRPATEQRINGTSSPKTNGGLNHLNGDVEMTETLPDGLEVQISRSAETDDKDINPSKKSAREEAWEESGCVLWDLAVNKEHAEFMVQNLVLEVLLANLVTSDSARITEISLVIIGNLACHDVLMNKITFTDKLLETILEQLFSDDAPCLCEVCRLLTLGLQGCQRAVWARAMQSDDFLSRVLWIVENTLNPVLIEKSVGLLLAIMENQQDVITILLQPLMNLGLPDLLVNLLASEMGKLTSERTPERYPVLESILRAIEALSATDGYSEGICSNKELVQMAIELIKIPEKIEISNSCVTAAVLIANILADVPDLAFKLAEDFPLLQSLLDLFPFTSEDFEARNALWSLVARLLVRIQEADMSPSRLSQYVSMLVERSDMIEDTLLASEWDRSPECDNLTASLYSRTAAIKCIVKILYQWNLVKGEVSVMHNDTGTAGSSFTDDRDVQKLLDCCLKHTS